ncbi:methylenetetrahydrofolate reductase [NAD(P)H] [Mycobacteroides abscessus]|uniref:Methylenetetrahydrofolate reductase n=1 Tax=Mycobacteroides abscessus subsp. bolletii TaxID=319705 RepID=A0A9Q7SIQ5_9MYCO|nr:methylenetetrahydrofolate reductase [NAD(P)H] [Mycobacteroides abscessus]AMU20993.1 5,10-methylenetetrahydrofolate reductase [Mycobacteroides abscessus]MBN7304014.1 methylenetetrahydrofolate reductase [NAD(P)H] [Mycobacteroides abscessus subsp. bolletii]MDO3127802.1 methylenetetrahydrofolate reductase [NAD(P)H] [Mycobacteroides abscessus subsp. bolletii]UEA50092.1 methylenetetrahydrofolate reductase [NAD(P)H] [Mycobacteroides abscessus subsp. abscessus]UEA54101.1 methylenetetrahydrofolate r
MTTNPLDRDGPVAELQDPGSIADRLTAVQPGEVAFSVEFMPPRDEAAEARLWRAARVFERYQPVFVSVTYGAGGSTRDRTVRVTGELAENTTLLPVAHLTAVGHTVDELRAMVGAYVDRGITNILALRGDPAGDVNAEWIPHPGGLTYAEQLVRLVRDLGDFHVGVASFPEGHPQAIDLESDTANLVNKLRAGAEYSITQMFFDVDDYLRLRDRVVAADPEQGAKPIVPGLMPITSLRSVRRQVELSSSTLPTALEERLLRAAGDGPEENRDEVRKVGVEVTTTMASRLLAEGVPCLHFMTLNFARATSEVLENLGVRVTPGTARG